MSNIVNNSTICNRKRKFSDKRIAVIQNFTSDLTWGLWDSTARKPVFAVGVHKATRMFANNWCRPISKGRIEAHLKGEKTYYYCASHVSSHCLIMIDVDCQKVHNSGTAQGAKDFVTRLTAEHGLLPGAYAEVSTGGVGQHVYIMVSRMGVSDSELRKALDRLDARLKAMKPGSDIENVEVKGRPCRVSENGITFGQLGKIPRLTGLDSADCLQRCIINASDLLSPSWDIPAEAIPEVKRLRHSGSSQWFGDRQRGQVETNASWASGQFFGNPQLDGIATSGRHVVTALDVGIWLTLVNMIQDTVQDGAELRSRRVMRLWAKLYAEGQVARAPDASRYSAIYKALADRGLIDCQDNYYTPPTRDEEGKWVGGQCMKWKLAAELVEELEGYGNNYSLRSCLTVPAKPGTVVGVSGSSGGGSGEGQNVGDKRGGNLVSTTIPLVSSPPLFTLGYPILYPCLAWKRSIRLPWKYQERLAEMGLAV